MQRRKSGKWASSRKEIHSEHHSKRNWNHKYQPIIYMKQILFYLPTKEIRSTDAQTSSKNCIASIVPSSIIKIRLQIVILVVPSCWYFVDKNDSNDNTINSIRFTENDTTGIRLTNEATYLIRFFERILGALTQPPINVEAVVQIPLQIIHR